jgi:outer membrane lipoprotein-sorting protein
MLKNAHTTMAFSQQTGEFLGMRIVQKYPGQSAPVVVTVRLLGSKINASITPSTLIWVAPEGAKKEPDMADVFAGTFH